jgi:hypothetical protein
MSCSIDQFQAIVTVDIDVDGMVNNLTVCMLGLVAACNLLTPCTCRVNMRAYGYRWIASLL